MADAANTTGGEHNGWTYAYKIGGKGEPAPAITTASDGTALTLTAGAGTIDIGSLTEEGTYKVTIASFAKGAATDAAPEATTTVTVTVTTTGGTVDASKYATLAKTADNEITVTPSQADRADTTKAWTYKYSFDDATNETTLNAGSLKFTVPNTAGTHDIKVTASDGTNTYTTTAKITVTAPHTDTDENDVVVSVKPKAGIGTITLTAYATQQLKKQDADAEANASDYVADTDDVKQKTKIEKKILVNNNFTKLGKEGTNTYLYTGTLSKDSDDNGTAVKVNGYEVEFQGGASVTVAEKANVTKISGNAAVITIDNSTVGSIALDDGSASTRITVSDAKVGDIDFGDEQGSLIVDSPDAIVGDVTDVTTATVTGGKVGNITAADIGNDSAEVTVRSDDDEEAVEVGDITSDGLVTIDSTDSKGISVGTLKASSNDTEFDLSGDAVSVKDFDFDYYEAEIHFDDFQGEVPAPKNADVDGAALSTLNADDRVTVKGDADINSITIEEESQITFDGALNVGSVDGSGKLLVAPGKLNVTSDASSDVKLVLNGAFKVGDVAYTSAHDTIDTDSFDNYGFTVTKTEGSDKDTFKVASLEFTGLTITPAPADIAKGQTQTFTASAYAPGSAIPEGYTIKFAFDGDDEYFTAVDNQNGTATVTVKDVDSTFSSSNKATLTAYLVDADGATNDDYDEGEADIKAVAVPATNFKSDTTGNVPLKVGQTYQFKITTLDGKAPTSFSVASNGATIQFAGATGSDYFYKVTGAKEGSYGVYVNGGGVEHRAAILVIKGVNVTTDTTAVTRAPGQTYQFKITAPSQPSFGAVGLKSVLASKSGNNYFYKVTASNVKGGHGIYVNGVRVAIFTVA